MEGTGQYNEKTILNQVAEGDEVAFAALFRMYAPLLEINIGRMIRDKYGTAEVLQETFIKLWLSRENLKKIIGVRAYLNKVAFNEALDYLSKLAKQNRLKLAVHNSMPLSTGPDDNLVYKETEEIIQNAINELPLQRKKIYKLSRNYGLNSFEIARELNLNPDYVRQAISASRNYIKDQLVRAGKILVAMSSIF